MIRRCGPIDSSSHSRLDGLGDTKEHERDKWSAPPTRELSLNFCLEATRIFMNIFLLGFMLRLTHPNFVCVCFVLLVLLKEIVV